MEQASCLLSSISVLVQDLSTPEVELAYAIAKYYWNQGLTTEAVKATLKYGFEIIDLERIVAITGLTNFSSQRVMTKAGLKYEKDAHYYGLDVVYYAILQEEFTKRVITPDSETRRLGDSELSDCEFDGLEGTQTWYIYRVLASENLSSKYESPGYWWRWLLRLGNRALSFQQRV